MLGRKDAETLQMVWAVKNCTKSSQDLHDPRLSSWVKSLIL